MPVKYHLVAASLLFALAGCQNKEKECEAGGCRQVYESRIKPESPSKSQVVRQADHVMVLFSATGRRANVATSHCAALFCKVKADKSVESVTISWMPKSLKKTYRPEAGSNFDISATLKWANSVGASVDRHGPYYIKEDLYVRAKNQADRLNGGSVLYKTVDDGLRPNSATNSVHAISDILCDDKFDNFLVTDRQHGRDAAATLKVYFDKEGFVDGRYKNDKQLLSEFDLHRVRRID